MPVKTSELVTDIRTCSIRQRFFLKRFYSESPCSDLEGQGLTAASRGRSAKSIQKEGISLMRVYEVLFIIAPNTEESDIEALITQMSDVITNQGAQITKLDRIGRRRLAYPIGKFNEGYYVVLT